MTEAVPVSECRGQTEVERFWSKVNKNGDDGCWVWTAGTNLGYGRFYSAGRNLQAYRWAWVQEHGAVPEGLELDHLCRNRACVNPAHLEPVPTRINVLRGVGMGARHARQTHCINGHELTPENTYNEGPEGRWRRCKTCHLNVQRRLRARKGSR